MSAALAAAPGTLDLDLVAGADGRTRVASWSQTFPQRVTAPMYVDPDAPGAAHLCVQNPTGGLFPGDDLRTRVRVGSGAALALSAQSATIVHAGGPARQGYDLTVDDGGVLEHLPGTAIPHPGAELYQHTDVALDGDAVFVGWERLASGRIARGERYGYALAELRTRIAVDGAPVAHDALRMSPPTRDARAPGVTGGLDYLATLTVLAPRRPSALRAFAAAANALLDGTRDPVGAASPLPGGAGIGVRLLGSRAPSLLRVGAELWRLARTELLGRPTLPTRVVR